MGKNLRFYLVCAWIFFGAISCGKETKTTRESLAEGFVTPPASIQTSVYWYWISDNISKEGVVKDLEAMKKAGINRAFIGNIGLEGTPYGKVKMLSEEWWEILHTALKTATELGIDIGIFNSPGWSQSGGPWVKPEQAMRYLTSSQTRVTGPQHMVQQLPQPIDIFQDVRVVAYPVTAEDQWVLTPQNSTIHLSPQVSEWERAFDGDTATRVTFPANGTVQVDWTARESFTARSLTFRPIVAPWVSEGEILVKENGAFRSVKSFRVNYKRTELNVGFVLDAPYVVSIPATTAQEFRVVLRGEGKPEEVIGFREIELSAAPRVEQYSEKTLAKMYPDPLPYWKEYQWGSQPVVDDPKLLVDPASVVDLTANMTADGTLTWDVPSGEWVILRMGMTPTGTKNSPASPEATGYEVDKMSRAHAEQHFYGHIGEILERIPAEDRKSFKVVVQDSYETGGQNFTDTFMEDFQKRYGYDPLPYLPVYEGVVVNSAEASDRFLWDVRRLVADKVAYEYVAGLRDISHQYGLTTWLENYGHWGFPGEFLQYGGQSDEIGGEFWAEGTLGNIENRAASSCGHIYGKTRISAESYTSSGKPFERHPAMIKPRGDRFFAEGINNTLLHVCISQPYDSVPGVNTWFGTEFNRSNTWFSQMDVFTSYLKRMNYMLQQGLNVADVAYFIGEDAPKMTGIVDPELPAGYQFDYINAEVIERDMTVRDGLLTLPHGTQYRILVLPKLTTMRPELLEKIQQLVLDGGVVLGPAPTRSPSLQNQPAADARVSEMAAALWGDVDGVKVKFAKRGKGMILSGMTMEEAFAQIQTVADCALPADAPLLYGHRTLGDIEIYFVTNQSDSLQTVTPEFRVLGKQPELWLPTTGEIRDLPAYTQSATGTAVPLVLQPNECAFVVFAKSTSLPPMRGVEANFPKPGFELTLSAPWEVKFDATMRGPVHPVRFEQLRDWSTMKEDSIKYYSGTALYTTQFIVDALPAEGQRALIDLGEVNMMAKVTLNGEYVGGVWTLPYALNVTPYLKKGENLLQVEVVNTWVNRLIGDSRLPEAERKTWSFYNTWSADKPLKKAGLLGPVRVEYLPR